MTDKNLDQLKAELDAAESAYANADYVYEAAYKASADEAADAAWDAALKAKRAYYKALNSQEKTDD